MTNDRGGQPPNWRAALRRHAEKVWRTGKGALPLGKPTEEMLARALGPLADDAVKIVEAYALGARHTIPETTRPPAEFGSRLLIVLNGVEAALGSEPWSAQPTGAARPHMIQSELWQLLRKVRESADLAYSREQDLIELDRRILLLLHGAGPLVPADISSTVGVDKAQVSRSVKRLLERRLIQREQIRSPLRLTREGERVGKRMVRLADLRNRELTIEISDEELTEFYDTSEVLLERAVALYERERQLAQSNGRGQQAAESSTKETESKGPERLVIDRSRVVSPLLTLSAYFSRSGALAFKRLTGLSSFEAFVLSEVGNQAPVEWAALAATLERDHSQAGRTINALMTRGLVEREGKPGRRHGRFYPSPDGERLYRIIQEAGHERSAFLLAPLSAEQRARFLATFGKLRRNAVAQLERERAFAELGRS